jgi:hypothetical protein
LVHLILLDSISDKKSFLPLKVRCCAAPPHRRLFAPQTAPGKTRGSNPGHGVWGGLAKQTAIPIHVCIENGPEQSTQNGPIRHNRPQHCSYKMWATQTATENHRCSQSCKLWIFYIVQYDSKVSVKSTDPTWQCQHTPSSI